MASVYINTAGGDMVSMHIIIQLNFTERNKKYINLKSFD